MKIDPTCIFDYLYDSIRNGKEFPITNTQALVVMEIIEKVRKGTAFK